MGLILKNEAHANSGSPFGFPAPYRGKVLAATDVLVQVFGFGFGDYTLMTSNSGLPGV